MTRIKVPVEVLLSVSDQFDNASNQLKMMNENLLRQIFMLMSNWYGQRGTAFQTDFKTAYEHMNVTIERMHVISQELKGIAVRFMDADQLQDFMSEQRMELFAKLSTTSSDSEPPKSFLEKAGDAAVGFGSGVKQGLGNLGDSLKDTATALYEDPLGTLGDMAYNATIGTAEDIKDAAVWGKDMVMSEEKREAFWAETQRDIDESGGYSNYIGEKAAVVLGSAAISRAGIKGGSKLKHDIGGDGGSNKGSTKESDKSGSVVSKAGVVSEGEGGQHLLSSIGKVDGSPSTVKYLEDSIRNEPFEHGLFFDKDGNVISELVSDGEKAKIDLSSYKKIAKDATFTHNHPNSSRFSIADLETAVHFDMAEIRAVTPNGVTFSLKRGTDGWGINPLDVEKFFKQTQRELSSDPIAKTFYKEGNTEAVWDLLYSKMAEKIGGKFDVYK
ncbi:WXG100 family type VII secretion target [Neobacillus mesonae]|nr:WXG100 family type VII secretion target [Neobacillus mesonae]